MRRSALFDQAVASLSLAALRLRVRVDGLGFGACAGEPDYILSDESARAETTLISPRVRSESFSSSCTVVHRTWTHSIPSRD